MSFKINILNTNSFKTFEEYLMEVAGRPPYYYEGFVGQKWLDNVHGNTYYKFNEGWTKLINDLNEPGDYQDQLALYYKYPKVSVLPTPVVNDESWVLSGTPDVEYKGINGSWVPQSSITYAVWIWGGEEWLLEDFRLLVNGESILSNGEALYSPYILIGV